MDILSTRDAAMLPAACAKASELCLGCQGLLAEGCWPLHSQECAKAALQCVIGVLL